MPSQKTTISELVRQAIRERYLGSREQIVAMQRFVGSRKSTAAHAIEGLRSLRGGKRSIGSANDDDLIDSTFSLRFLEGRDSSIVPRWLELSTSDALILFSPATVANSVRAFICVPADAAVGRRAGDYLRRYRKSHNLELGDALIAASGVASGAML